MLKARTVTSEETRQHLRDAHQRVMALAAGRSMSWAVRVHVLLNRGYNGYVFERNNRRIIFSGDTALSDSFAELRASGPIDLAIMSIGAYNPWIHSPCTREQAVQMANEAGAHFIMPVHLAITFCRCMKIPARYCTGARGGSAHHAPISQFWPSLVSYLTASA
jgi:L-ascorbate metabolism protein UlaG (beta-lactamase superfamily)